MRETLPQESICSEFGAAFLPAHPDSIVGIALGTLGILPLNALRYFPENGSSGWYIWGGESLSKEPNFFQPLHVFHLATHCPVVIPYLGLAAGWRVLLAPGQVEVWYDPSLLAAQNT